MRGGGEDFGQGGGIVGGVTTSSAREDAEIFAFTFCQRRVFAPTIGILDLGENERISFHAHGPSDIEA